MAFYETNLGILVVINACIFYHQRRAKSASVPSSEAESARRGAEVSSDPKHNKKYDASVRDFVKTYLVGHLLAFAGDWLQGPHLYALYRYDKRLEERAVALLYGTGFVSAALSAAVAGQWADRLGRRRACLAYCAAYALSCLSVLSDALPVLAVGRALGGASTTLLYSAFDAWMVAEYHRRGVGGGGAGGAGGTGPGLSLAALYGWLTSLNSVVAVATGVLGEGLVAAAGTRVAPFLFAVLVFLLAAAWMGATWTENFGSKRPGASEDSLAAAFTSSVRAMWQDKRVFALTVASSVFESMMYLFVFFWSSAIISARSYAGDDADPPFGLIFGCFMCTMMAGSMLFNAGVGGAHDVAGAARVLRAAMALASISLFLAILLTSREHLVFWAFCVTELCVGMYYPSINFLKSNIVEDGSRARIYSLMRLPLSTFVVLAHSLAEEGDKHRNNVFLVFGGALLLAFMVVQRFLHSK